MLSKSFLTLTIFFITCFAAAAQTKEETTVAAAVEQLRLAMVNADSGKLVSLTSTKLSYGHSGGHVEDQKEFIEKIISGKSDFVKIDLSEQTISITRKTAVVRHNLAAVTNDNGKPGEVHLKVLLVWVKEKKHWLLLARQAVKQV